MLERERFLNRIFEFLATRLTPQLPKRWQAWMYTQLNLPICFAAFDWSAYLREHPLVSLVTPMLIATSILASRLDYMEICSWGD